MPVWKAIPGWEGWYEVSDGGLVRSLLRVSIANGAPATYAGRVLKAGTLKNGYQQVSLSRPGERRYAYVHQLVLEAFVGTAPAGMEVCHADGSRNNNRLGNLRYGTRSENARDRIAHGRGPTGEQSRGEKNGMTPLTEADVRRIRGMSGTLKAISEIFGVHLSTIHNIKTGKTWGHVR